MSEATNRLTVAELSVRRESGVVWLRLDNQRRKNALTVTMMESLLSELDRLDADPTVSIIVIEGAGGTFCSGMDIGSLDTDRLGPRPEELAVQIEEAVLSIGHPTVALVEGFVVGAGCQLASACDFRIAVAGSRMGLPPAKMGLVYPPSSLMRMREIVGDLALRQLVFTANLASHHQFEDWGWAEVVPERVTAIQRIAELSETMMSRSALTIRATKEILHAISTGAQTDHLFAQWQTEAMSSGENAEGIVAFSEKREPAFPSRAV